MNEEILRILSMVKNDIMNEDEAAELLSALYETDEDEKEGDLAGEPAFVSSRLYLSCSSGGCAVCHVLPGRSGIRKIHEQHPDGRRLSAFAGRCVLHRAEAGRCDRCQ